MNAAQATTQQTRGALCCVAASAKGRPAGPAGWWQPSPQYFHDSFTWPPRSTFGYPMTSVDMCSDMNCCEQYLVSELLYSPE
jgi:hypothetical protein